MWQDSRERSAILWARSKVYYIVRMVINPHLLGSVRRELLFLLMHFHSPWDLRVRRRWLDKIYVVVRRYIALVFILRNYSEYYWKGHGLFSLSNLLLPNRRTFLEAAPCNWRFRFVAMLGGGGWGCGNVLMCFDTNVLCIVLQRLSYRPFCETL